MVKKVFQIGFNKCGTKFLTELFKINGLPGVHWAAGALAENIAYSKAAGQPPLSQWCKDFILFTDMECVHKFDQPMIESFKDYQFLDNSFPGAIFVLNTRNVDDWLVSRYTHQGGAYAKFHALHLGVSIPDLAEVWYEDWHAHVTSCREYFRGRNEFVEIDIDVTKPNDYQEIFSKWFDVSLCPDLPDKAVFERRAKNIFKLDELLFPQCAGGKEPKSDLNAAVTSNEFVEFSVPSSISLNEGGFSACSGMTAWFDSTSNKLTNVHGRILPLVRSSDGKYYAGTRKDKFTRTAGVVNRIAKTGHKGRFLIDMQDGRKMGSSPATRVARPVISYCRRKGAENIFLWPLPEYHSIGSDYFPGWAADDPFDFDGKLDLAVWRGSLSGHCSNVEGNEFNSPVHQVIRSILTSKVGSEEFEKSKSLIRKNSRFSFVKKFYSHDSLDVALTPTSEGRQALEKLGEQNLMSDFRRHRFFYKHKYIISLRGYDTGSNFLMAANSNSVVLKEEDGWELFYSFLFDPWVHYIPLASGGTDLEEKLLWARANEEACKKMSREARVQCRKLADPKVRDKYLESLAGKYLELCEAL